MMEQKIQTNNVVELAKPEPEEDNLKQGREVRFDILEPWPESVGSEIFSETADIASVDTWMPTVSRSWKGKLNACRPQCNKINTFRQASPLIISRPT